MAIFKKYIYLVIIILYAQSGLSHNQKYFSDSTRAVNMNRSAIQLFQKGLLPQALDTFKLSLEIRKIIWDTIPYRLAGTYNNIGIIYGRLGQFDLALQYYNNAENNYLSADNFPIRSIVSLYNNIGINYRFKLDYSKALQYFNQALSLSINELQSPPGDIAHINYNISEIYYLINEYDKAISLITENIEMAYFEDQISYHELLAFIYQQKDKLSESKKNYQKYVYLTVELYSKNHIDVALAYINYANFLIDNNEFKEAEETLKKSFQILDQIKPVNRKVLSTYYTIKGSLANNLPVETQNLQVFKKQKIQNLNQAIDWYQKGLSALNFPKNYSIEAPLKLDKIFSVIDCFKILKLIADNYSELSDIEQTSEKPVFTESMAKAIETYQIIGSVIEQARRELTDDNSKIELTALEYATFQKIIKISYSAYSITNDQKFLELAFQNAERIKSSSVYDKISSQLALENSLVPDSILNAENKFNQTIAIYSNKLYEENNQLNPDSALINEYTNEIFAATKKRDELNRLMESEYKNFYELKYSNSMLSAHEIQNLLTEDQVIIEYVLTETENQSELYTFTIRKDGIYFYKLKIDSTFDTSLENMFQFASSSEYLFTKNEDSKKFSVSSNILYKHLIQPVKHHIQNKNIIVIPDGKLSYIPFDALLVNLPDTSKTIEFNQLNYLIRSNCINYSNSANLLFKNKPNRKKTKIQTLAFAPVYREGETIEIAQKQYPLIPLPGVQKEVSKISKIMNTEVYSGEDASEENFRKHVEKYDILHLAMHAFINDSLPAFSSFAFTQKQTEDPEKNGLLNTMDIYNLRLNAKLAVLSACNTGTGQLKKGEGIMSLARGFLYAGCPTIVMSLWEVEDESATRIMSSFYKNIKKGKTKDQSLRLAKLEYLESVNSRKAHPHYWLSFVSIGDNSPLYISYDFYFFILLLVALSAIGIDQAIRIRKARKKRAS